MKTLISEKFLRKLEPHDADIWDTKCRGLVLRCRASGRHTYRFRANHRWMTIGSVDDFTPDEARREADLLRGDIARGKDPVAERRAAHATSLKTYLEKEYGPWVRAHRKTGAETVARLTMVFADFQSLALKDITLARVERWRTSRVEAGTSPSTVNRDLTALRGALSRAVEFGLLSEHPLRRLRLAKVDTAGVVRYLSSEEEQRLRAALKARDERRRTARTSANEWRLARQYETFKPFGVYTDHLTPVVLLALNTGLRRGELFALQWADIRFEQQLLVVRGEDAKSGQTRIVNLNSEAVSVLRGWRPADAVPSNRVFAGRVGKRDDLKKGWARLLRDAQITSFRFHDLRHTFASKLVMAGVDLNTVRELLGHSDLKMTIRYAHLSPAVKASAVEKLISA